MPSASAFSRASFKTGSLRKRDTRPASAFSRASFKTGSLRLWTAQASTSFGYSFYSAGARTLNNSPHVGGTFDAFSAGLRTLNNSPHVGGTFDAFSAGLRALDDLGNTCFLFPSVYFGPHVAASVFSRPAWVLARTVAGAFSRPSWVVALGTSVDASAFSRPSWVVALGTSVDASVFSRPSWALGDEYVPPVSNPDADVFSRASWLVSRLVRWDHRPSSAFARGAWTIAPLMGFDHRRGEIFWRTFVTEDFWGTASPVAVEDSRWILTKASSKIVGTPSWHLSPSPGFAEPEARLVDGDSRLRSRCEVPPGLSKAWLVWEITDGADALAILNHNFATAGVTKVTLQFSTEYGFGAPTTFGEIEFVSDGDFVIRLPIGETLASLVTGARWARLQIEGVFTTALGIGELLFGAVQEMPARSEGFDTLEQAAYFEEGITGTGAIVRTTKTPRRSREGHFELRSSDVEDILAAWLDDASENSALWFDESSVFGPLQPEITASRSNPSVVEIQVTCDSLLEGPEEAQEVTSTTPVEISSRRYGLSHAFRRWDHRPGNLFSRPSWLLG